MKLTDKSVLILGAGFTKAFLPKAPLLIDDYDGKYLLKKYSDFKHAKKILENEINSKPSGKINIERLLTRLQGRMPYDREHNALPEIAMLMSDLKSVFSKKLLEAKDGEFHNEDLDKFARICLEKGASFITFNYDDVLDQALWEVNKILTVPTDKPYWHPDGGYGFFCRPSEQTIVDTNQIMDRTNMLLLKLHGSLNWRIRKGYESPLSIDAVVHHEPWLPSLRGERIDTNLIDIHLEPEPFIVPPILTKDSLIKQPILRLLWAIAYQKLSEADNIVFIGYSMPITDIATSFLFSESVQNNAKIRVVNLGGTPKQQKELRARYREVFPRLRPNHFIFKDAREWCQEVVNKNLEKVVSNS